MMKWTLEDVLPHRPPMQLIDEVESFEPGTKSLTAAFTVREGQVFHDGVGVPGWVAIEYMAQASAALAGFWDRHREPERPARPGLLLGSRLLKVGLERFETGRTYRVTAVNAFNDADAAAFECAIRDDSGDVVASATLNAYRPQDFAGFLKEQMKT